MKTSFPLAIVPNLKKRLSGVTSTVIHLVPYINALGYNIRAFGFGLPEAISKITLLDFLRLYKKPRRASYPIFHARRNNEMLLGCLLRDIFRFPIKVIFTSASQRRHTKYTQWLMSRMDYVIATSKKNFAWIAPFLQGAKKKPMPMCVVMHGVDTKIFSPSNAKDSLKRSLGLDPSVHYIGCFGRIRPKKGTDLFVKAMITCLQKQKNWKALVIGRVTSPHKAFFEQLRALVKEAGMAERIIFLEESLQIQKYYQTLDLYVVPSLYEGYGLTPLEAMACAVPVIATDVGVFREIIPEHCGCIVDTNVEAIAREVSGYLQDMTLLRKHGLNARAHVEAHFSLEFEAQGILSVYKQLQGVE
eukprot:TRINITY_DN9110_c0_g1_i1.p1 TRINITY_DN9110_c0_g1~~TRINITY_DN9110_c0_g1_i1.p1  ORF type:complete len:359 (+),score=-86.62 TRINITY_DN9110_c0_g1_i1:94-1170(+)